MAWSVLSGWLLSLAGAVNRVGYSLAFLPLLFWGIRSRRGALAALLCRISRHTLRFARHRIRQPLPAIFAITALASAIGGILYAPNNYDFLSYRFARLLHWWNAGQWHWIHSANSRLNFSGTGMEWAMMPSLVLTQSSRLFFLLNFISYLLMPGLVFSVLTLLGIGRRTSWFWMWILPSGYCYASTAGGVGNDAFGTVLVLAALYFGCRATRHGSITALWLGVLAAGLMTAVKGTNLPLVLPFLLAARPAWVLIKSRWAQTLGIVCVALAISFAPTAILNHMHTGDWTGDPTNQEKVKTTSTSTALLGNGMLLIMGMLTPPVFPQAATWNTHSQDWIPDGIRDRLAKDFPRFSLRLGELGTEENAGLGCGITILLLTTAGVALFTRRRKASQPCRWDVLGGFIVACVAYGSLISAESTPRLLTPYYPFIVASVLALPGMDRATRMHWWRRLAILMSLSALLIVILTPLRPLWPAQTVTTALRLRNTESRLLARISSVYTVYHDRADALAPARALLPDNTHTIGFIQSSDDPEVSLWKPLGQRQVMDVIGPEMSNRQWLDKMRIDAIVARRTMVEKQCGSIEKWIIDINGSLIATIPLTIKVSEGTQEWCIVKLNPPAPVTL